MSSPWVGGRGRFRDLRRPANPAGDLGMWPRCLPSVRYVSRYVAGPLPLVLTVEQRDALRERELTLAQEDEGVIAAAAVGSLVVDGGDCFRLGPYLRHRRPCSGRSLKPLLRESNRYS